MKSTRVVVVGYGMAGKLFHCYLVNLAPGLELHGVVSRAPDTRECIVQEQGCRAYASLGEALGDPDVGLVVLATPHSVHAEQAIQAMDAGKHVVVDKVMALDQAECDAMVAAAERNRVMLNVFQNRRFDGDYLTVRKLIEEQALGSVRWVEMAWQSFRAQRGWRGRAAMGGGRLYDLGAHLIDQACMLFPSAVQTVYCRMHYDHEGSDVESEAFVVVTFAEGTTAVCDVSGLAAIPKPRAANRSSRWHRTGSAGLGRLDRHRHRIRARRGHS